MKKTLVCLGILAVIFSCSVENQESAVDTSAALSQKIDQKSFKGIFTTLNSKYRAVVSIDNLNQTKPLARLSFVGGKTIIAKGKQIQKDEQEILAWSFAGSEISFIITATNSLADIKVTETMYRGLTADIKLVENSILAPVNPVLGTWECTACNGHPVVNSGVVQSFNMIIPDGDGAITTQMILGNVAYGGIGDQNSCVMSGGDETCTNTSGDGTTNVGFYVNGNPVTWTGTNTSTAGGTEFTVDGTWSWPSISYGILTGTYQGTSNLNVIYSEDFNGFTGAGFAPTPAAGQLDSDIIIANGFSGSLAFGGTQTSGDYARGTSTGGESTGGIYAFEVGASNFAVGVQPAGSDFTPGEFDFRIENTTGTELNNFLIDYNIYVRNDQGRANSLNFAYSVDGTNFTPVSSLDFVSPEASTGTTFNLTARQGLFNATVADGAYIYFRLEGDDVSGSGARDEFAIDDILLQAN